MLQTRDFDFLNDVYDVLYLNLRESDVKEIKDSTGKNPSESLADIMGYTDILKVFEDEFGRILGVYGIADVQDLGLKAGNIFLLATDELVEKYPIEFLRISKREVEGFIEEYEYLFNYVSSENKDSIKWLDWLGFDVYKDKDVLLENPKVPFYFFKLERK